MRSAATTAVIPEQNAPSLGALNRQFTMVTQQLTAAHQVIGRVAAERDALRQHLAELQGIPVEEVLVTATAPSPATPTKPTDLLAGEPLAASLLARLNAFGRRLFPPS
jgi:hypothetical protein